MQEPEGGSSRSEDGTSESRDLLRRVSVPSPMTVFGASVIGLFVLASLVVMRQARAFLLPIVIAAILALLLDPAVRFLSRIRLPRSVASALLLTAFLALLLGGLRLTAEPAREYLAQAPQKLHRIEHKLQRLLQPVEEVSQAAKQVSEMADMTEKMGERVSVSQERSFEDSIFAGTQTFLVGMVVTAVLTYFFLSSGDVLVRRWAELFGDRRRTLRIARQIQRDVSGHLWTISLINAGLGACVGVVCWLSGLPNPVLWGVVAALLNFVPYLGAMVGVLVVAGVSLLTVSEPLAALKAPLLYSLITGLEGSFLTPMVLGRRFSLHPTVIFVGLLFWSFLWGVAGALLAVPLLLIGKIVCDNVPDLNKLGRAIAR